MKLCPMCLDEFADKFGFCPVDGVALGGRVAESAGGEAAAEAEPVRAAKRGGEYQLTMLDDAGPLRRMVLAVGNFTARRGMKWPEFKRASEGELREVPRFAVFHLKSCIFVCVETGFLYIWVLVHHLFEDAIKGMPNSPGKVGVEVLLTLLLAVNCVAVLAYSWHHLRQAWRPKGGSDGRREARPSRAPAARTASAGS